MVTLLSNRKHVVAANYSMVSSNSLDALVREALTQNLKGIWRFAFSLSGNPETANDLVQATCVRALERSHQVTSDHRLDAWLMTICRSIWLNDLRAQRIRQTQSLSHAPDAALLDPRADTETNFFASEVFTKVMQLPEAQRATVMLVFVQGYAYREAADILDVPIGTVMSRLSAARGKLKHLMNDANTAAGE